MMMKSTIRTLFLLSALLFSACEKDDSIFTELSIRFVMPDSRPVEKLEIRTDIIELAHAAPFGITNILSIS